MSGWLNRISPYSGIGGIIVGVIGITLAVYFHYKSIKEREPTYYVHPSRSRIISVEEAKTSDLQFLYKGKPIGNRSVTSIRIYFWNGGKLPIRKNDVLSPLRFELGNSTEILESRVIRTSRDLINFRLEPREGFPKNALPFSFDILEKSDGASIQIIYAGNPNSDVFLRGEIIEAGIPRLLESPSTERYYKRPDPKDTLRERRTVMWAVIIFSFVPILISMFYWLKVRKRGEEMKEIHKKMTITALVFLIVYGSFGIYLYYDIQKAFSPGVPNKIWQD